MHHFTGRMVRADRSRSPRACGPLPHLLDEFCALPEVLVAVRHVSHGPYGPAYTAPARSMGPRHVHAVKLWPGQAQFEVAWSSFRTAATRVGRTPRHQVVGPPSDSRIVGTGQQNSFCSRGARIQPRACLSSPREGSARRCCTRVQCTSVPHLFMPELEMYTLPKLFPLTPGAHHRSHASRMRGTALQCPGVEGTQFQQGIGPCMQSVMAMN